MTTEETASAGTELDELWAAKSAAAAQVEKDMERLMASVRHLLETDYRYVEMERAEAKGRRSLVGAGR